MAPAFRLRKATLDDFSDYYKFYVNPDFHWLMFDPIDCYEQPDEPFEDNYFFSKEDSERIHQDYINTSKEDFLNHLSWYRIFMVIVDKKCVGYVKLEKYQCQFIVREWPMDFEYRNETLLEGILEKIEPLKPASCSELRIVSLNDSATPFLIAHNYKKDIMPFYLKIL